MVEAKQNIDTTEEVKTVPVRIPAKLHKRLSVAFKEGDTTFQAVVLESLLNWLEAGSPQPKPSKNAVEVPAKLHRVVLNFVRLMEGPALPDPQAETFRQWIIEFVNAKR